MRAQSKLSIWRVSLRYLHQVNKYYIFLFCFCGFCRFFYLFFLIFRNLIHFLFCFLFPFFNLTASRLMSIRYLIKGKMLKCVWMWMSSVYDVPFHPKRNPLSDYILPNKQNNKMNKESKKFVMKSNEWTLKLGLSQSSDSVFEFK